VLFFLTLEGRVNQWCNTLPLSSIHYFEHLIKELHLEFDSYDYQDVLKIINELRMKYNESIEVFFNQFLHFCYEFPKEDIDWDFFKQKFEHLVHISFHGESKPPNVSSSPTLVNRETPLISEEGPNIYFVPCPPLFQVPIGVLLFINVEVGKSINQIVDSSLQPSLTSHYSDLVEENLEIFMEPRVKTNPSIPQDDTSILNLNLEYGSTESITSSREIFHSLSSTCHDSLYHDPLDHSAPQTSSSYS